MRKLIQIRVIWVIRVSKVKKKSILQFITYNFVFEIKEKPFLRDTTGSINKIYHLYIIFFLKKLQQQKQQEKNM